MSTPAHKAGRSAQRMSAYRERMREKGLRQKTVWVPDTSNPAVVEYYRQSALAIAADVSEEAEMQVWREAASEAVLKDEPPYDWGDREP